MGRNRLCAGLSSLKILRASVVSFAASECAIKSCFLRSEAVAELTEVPGRHRPYRLGVDFKSLRDLDHRRAFTRSAFYERINLSKKAVAHGLGLNQGGLGASECLLGRLGASLQGAA